MLIVWKQAGARNVRCQNARVLYIFFSEMGVVGKSADTGS